MVRLRRLAWTMLRLGLGVGLLAWLVVQADPSALGEALGRARPEPMALACALFLIGVVFSAVPWKLLLPPLRLEVSWRDAVDLSLMGFCVNNLVPGGLGGDALRAWAAARGTGRPVPAVASVLMDRWLAFVCLVLIALALAGTHAGTLRAAGLGPVVLGVITVLLLMFGASLALFGGGLRLARPVLDRIAMGAPAVGLVASLREYGGHPRRLLLCLLLTMVTPVLDGLGFCLIGAGLGLEQPLWTYLLMIPVVRVIHHLPLSVNAVGTQDVAVVFFWGALGVPAAEALTMSVGAHALKLVVALVAGAIYLSSWGGRLALPPPPSGG